MTSILETLSEFSYIGIFVLLIGVNAAPLFMPPTWIILASFYALESDLNPFFLAVVGATGATIGRFILKQISSFFRNLVGKEQKTNLDAIGNFLNHKKYGYALASFIFAATPLPSNMLFVAYGMMRAKSIGLYVGFWLGRIVSYYIMITISEVVLTPFLELFEEKYIGILVADGIGVASVILFTSINWSLLLTQRKLKLVRPKLWRF
jgi:membrane protein YqaA with SNARE-associated domain